MTRRRGIRLAARDALHVFVGDTDPEAPPPTMVSFYVFDARAGEAPIRTREDAVTWIGERLHRTPALTRRLHRVPADLDFPYWVETDVDPDHHVRYETIGPTSRSQLHRMLASTKERRLDLSAPPWEVHVLTDIRGVEDLPEGATIVALLLHHSVTDGLGAVEIARALLDDPSATPSAGGRVVAVPGTVRAAAALPFRYARMLPPMPHVALVEALGGLTASGRSPPPGRSVPAPASTPTPAVPAARRRPYAAAGGACRRARHGHLGERRDPDGRLGRTSRLPRVLRGDSRRLAGGDRSGIAPRRGGNGVGEQGHAHVCRPAHRPDGSARATPPSPRVGRSRETAHPASGVGCLRCSGGCIARVRPGDDDPTSTPQAGGAHGRRGAAGQHHRDECAPRPVESLRFGDSPAVEAIGTPMLNRNYGLVHSVTSLGEVLTLSFLVSDSCMPDPGQYERYLAEAFAELSRDCLPPAPDGFRYRPRFDAGRAPGRMNDVTATILDGKATRDEIFEDLKVRVDALKAKGVTPGLGTILVGDDPGSAAYVRGKHNDCAKVGITSIRKDLPPTSPRSSCSRRSTSSTPIPPAPATSCSSRCRSISTRTRRSSAWIRARTPTDCTRSTSAGSCSARRLRCPARRAASSTCCAATTWRSPARTWWWSVVASPSVARSVCC